MSGMRLTAKARPIIMMAPGALEKRVGLVSYVAALGDEFGARGNSRQEYKGQKGSQDTTSERTDRKGELLRKA